MKKSVKIVIVSGVAIAAAISVLAFTVHLRLLAIEGNEENTQESTSEKIKEAVNVITNPNAEHTKLQSRKKMRVQNNKKRKVSDMEIKCADCGCLPSECKIAVTK